MEALKTLEAVEENDISELTGKTGPTFRSDVYKEKRVFFMTPQTLQNDLDEERLSKKDIVLLIFDEAHRATGNYSYVKIIEKMEGAHIGYRILALSATPGNSMEYIQQVVLNLCISRIEVRTDSDEDVKPYIHQKEIMPVVISRSPDSERAKYKIDEIVRNIFSVLLESNVIPPNINKFLNANSLQKRHYMDILEHMRKKKQSLVFEIGESAYEKAFDALKVLGSFLHAKKILVEQGIKAFNGFLSDFQASNSHSENSVKEDLLQSRLFADLLERTEEMAKFHPKFLKLRTLLKDFFAQSSSSSKCMVFTQNRSTASEITAFLAEYSVIKPAIFIGQANSSTLGMSQDEQLDVIQRFKSSELNVLVATCIGEEGLDIGEIDLIVCFDSGFTPVRLLQRFGRTGRKRNGKVVMLLMQGKENEAYKKSVTQSKKLTGILKNIASNIEAMKRDRRLNTPSLRFYSFNPRMIPEGTTPELILEAGKAEIMDDVSFGNEQLEESLEEEIGKVQKKRKKDDIFDSFENDFVRGSKTFDGKADKKAFRKFDAGFGKRPISFSSKRTGFYSDQKFSNKRFRSKVLRNN